MLRFPEAIRHELSFDQLNRLLLWCVEQRASDIVFCPGDAVWMQVDGIWIPCTDTAITNGETQIIVNATTCQSSRAGYVRSGKSIDYAYALRIPNTRSSKQRFRVNATSTSKGIYIVMRALPRTLPLLSNIEGLEPGIEKALYPSSGLIVISGVMGSGKSTFLAAVVHSAIQSKAVGRQILTLEDPIEFDFSSLQQGQRHAPIAQSAVHIDVADWATGVRSMTRRKGEIIIVGECRDEETISALLGCVEQGVTAYTTVHAQDVPQTVTRMVNAFPEEKRSSVAAVLKANLQLVIHQRLVRRQLSEEDKARNVPGRIALREYLAINDKIRKKLFTIPDDQFLIVLGELVATEGQSLQQDAERKYKQGLLPPEVYASI